MRSLLQVSHQLQLSVDETCVTKGAVAVGLLLAGVVSPRACELSGAQCRCSCEDLWFEVVQTPEGGHSKVQQNCE